MKRYDERAECAECTEGAERRKYGEGAECAEGAEMRAYADGAGGAEGAVSRVAETAVRARVNAVTEQVIGAAIDVHGALGPGLLESAYQACLWHELTERRTSVERQKALPIRYRGIRVSCGYRVDFLVEGEVIVEIKAVHQLEPIHEAQRLSYLKISRCPVGLLINFNVKQLKTGIRRLVNELPE
ncbi:MAG: GxxExxY protein [Gemmatimonadota bacterium]